jgi:hypothetical protein
VTGEIEDSEVIPYAEEVEKFEIMISGIMKKIDEEKKKEEKPKLLHLTPNLKFGIKSLRNGKFLHVKGETNKHAFGVGIHGWEGHGGLNSTWEFVASPDEFNIVGIRNVHSKFYLNVWGGKTEDGTYI